MKCGASRGFSSIFLTLLLVLVAWAEEPPEVPPAELPVVKLSPKVRTATRDKAWFDRLSCTETAAVTPVNADEARWLDARKQACVQQYQGYGRSGVR